MNGEGGSANDSIAAYLAVDLQAQALGPARAPEVVRVKAAAGEAPRRSVPCCVDSGRVVQTGEDTAQKAQ
eukprot:SAG22_NODE_21400_length_257_cov_0.905063_1_plen_70_part_00